MKRIVQIFILASAFISSSIFASDYTYVWKDGECPTSILDGKVALTYADCNGENRIQNMNFSIEEGDSVTFTGEKMKFVNCNSHKTASIKIPNYTKIFFKNDVDARSFEVSKTTGSNARVWLGRETFIGTDWVTIFESAKLDDIDLLSSSQYRNKYNSTQLIPEWGNRDMEMHPCHIKRSSGSMSCQYQGQDSLSVVYILAEFRQNGNDIQVRIKDVGRVIPSDLEKAKVGVDIDELCGQYVCENRIVRTTNNENGGFGLNRIVVNIMDAICRFEGSVSMIGSPTAKSGVRLEFSDVTKMENSTYFYPYSYSEIVLQNGSKDATAWYNNVGSGAIIFETTKPTTSLAETNCIEITGTWKTTGTMRVRGIDGYPMILRTKDSNSYPTNGHVIVESNGILEMNGQGSQRVGIRGGACDITVNSGGILRQGAIHLFGTNTEVIINGGVLELGATEEANPLIDIGLTQLKLRDGARIVSCLSKDKSFRFGSLQSCNTWYIGGNSPSTNEAPIQFQGYNQFMVSTNTFNVAKLADGTYDADFVSVAPFVTYTGTAGWQTNVLRKIGLGTFRLDALYNIPGWVDLEQGTILLGKDNVWGDKKPTINFRGGNIKVASGTVNELGLINLYEDAQIALEEGATLKFPELVSANWTPNKKLNILLPKSNKGLDVMVKFGDSPSSLSQEQLKQVFVNGRPAKLDENGRIIRFGFSIVIR